MCENKLEAKKVGLSLLCVPLTNWQHCAHSKDQERQENQESSSMFEGETNFDTVEELLMHPNLLLYTIV